MIIKYYSGSELTATVRHATVVPADGSVVSFPKSQHGLYRVLYAAHMHDYDENAKAQGFPNQYTEEWVRVQVAGNN